MPRSTSDAASRGAGRVTGDLTTAPATTLSVPPTSGKAIGTYPDSADPPSLPSQQEGLYDAIGKTAAEKYDMNVYFNGVELGEKLYDDSDCRLCRRLATS